MHGFEAITKSLALTSHNLGLICRDPTFDCLHSAFFYLSEALVEYRDINKIEPCLLYIAKVLHDLGMILGDDKKNYPEARKYFVEAIENLQMVYSKNDPQNAKHPDIAVTLTYLGRAYLGEKDIKNACNSFNQSMTMFQHFYKENPDHDDIVKVTDLFNKNCAKM